MTLTRRDALKRTAILGAAAAAAPGMFTRAQSSGSVSVSLPDLPYAFDALEPAIDTRTMRIHHGKHHAGYTRKFNAAAEGVSGFSGVEDMVSRLSEVPASVRTAVRNNGGGFLNHAWFWESMAPPGEGGGGAPTGKLATALKRDFGSLDGFTQAFSAAAGSVFGSGWGWLIQRPSGRLAVTSTPNQDNPLMKGVVADDELGRPLLGLDVWEHAYYLHYQNRRGDYISNWWKLVNWDTVESRLA